MRLLKLGIISVVVLFTITSLLGLLLPSTVIVSRAIDVNATAKNITALTQSISSWSKWVRGTENLKSATDQNAQLANGGSINLVNNGTTASFIWTTPKGKQQTGKIQVIEGQNFCTVQWQFQEKIGWLPWQRFSSMLNEKMLGPVMEQSLQTLKGLAEKAP